MRLTMQLTALVAYACALLIIVPVNAMYFNLLEGKTQCFLAEVPPSTLVLGKYKIMDFNALTPLANSLYGGNPVNMAIQVSATDPGKVRLLQQDLQKEGTFTFTNNIAGEHQICIQTTNNEGQNRVYRVELTIDVGEQAVDYTNIAKSEHLSAIEVEIRRLNDRIAGIRGESDYQRTREEAFRNTSESNNSRVVWYNILVAVIVAAAGVFQAFYLKRFFKRKKVA